MLEIIKATLEAISEWLLPYKGIVYSSILGVMITIAFVLHNLKRSSDRMLLALRNYRQNTNALRIIERVDDLAGFIKKANSAHANFKNSIFEMLSEFINIIKINELDVMVDDESAARLLYAAFWDQIIESQKNSHSSRSVEVFVVHSAKLDVWEEDNWKLVEKQKEFSALGGVLRRLLVRRESSEPIERYKEISEKMKAKNIHVEILELLNDDSEFDPLDFLLVKLDDEKYVFDWGANWTHLGPKFGQIISATLSVEQDFYGKRSFEFNRLINKAKHVPAKRTKFRGWSPA